MQITVKLFGPEAALVGASDVAVDLEAETPTGADLRRALGIAEPRLAGTLAHCRFAVNHEFADDAVILGAGDEVALIGMVSGG